MPSIEEQLRRNPPEPTRVYRSWAQLTKEEQQEMMNRTPADWEAEFQKFRADLRAGRVY
jgi:hypothetical protein